MIRSDSRKKSDLFTIREVRSYYAPFLRMVQNRDVLDVGGHIGSFTHFALRGGARSVTIVEPEPSNLRMIGLNHSNDPRVTIVEGAVSSVPDREVDLYRGTGTCTTMHTLVEVRSSKREIIRVRTVSILDLLASSGATHLKFDAEGAEYFLWNFMMDIPTQVESIAIEITTRPKSVKSGNRPALLMEALRRQFDPVHVYGLSNDPESTQSGLFIGRR